ncbi:MAG: glycosyltransferase family 2 protein [Aestuariibaculum sp.]
MPFFSIVIPLYNKENYIEDTLNSVLNQTFQDFEVIVVNDGSTDNGLKIVEQTLQYKKHISILSQKKKGLSATRNKGISLAQGSVVALLDADDLWHNDYLKEIFNLYKTFPEASLFGSDYIERHNKRLLLEPSKNIDKTLKNSIFTMDDFFTANLFQPIIMPSSFAFKKEVFKTTQFDCTTDFAEDILFYIESNLSHKFAYSYKALVTILINIPNQMTKVGFKGKRLPNFDKFEEIAKSNIQLKQFLDTYRYYFLIDSRLTNDTLHLNALKKHLNLNHLTPKQRFLLNCPLFILKVLKKIKKYMLKWHIRLTSY